MYDPGVTAANIERVERSLGITLQRHTPRQCEAAATALGDLLNDEGVLTRPLKRDEAEFIQNEVLLSKLDFRYWAERYAKIRHPSENRMIPCIPNVAQQMMLDVLGDLERERVAIMAQILKARQLGFSTILEMLVTHRAQFYSHVTAVIGSSSPEQSSKMSNMMERALSLQPWYLLPGIKSHRIGVIIEFDQYSSISIQHGAQAVGIGRGDTPTVCHLSELADYPDPEELVDAALLRAMHESPFTLLALESTAKGVGNWWHNTWQHSKENWHLRLSRLCPMFFPWFLGSDIYPTESWLRKHPVPDTWIPMASTAAHMERAERYVRANDLLRKYLGERWTLPRHQAWYYEVERAEYEKKKNLQKFLSEMPADDIEAFQNTNPTIFDVDTIDFLHGNAKEPPLAYGISADASIVPGEHQPAEIERDPGLPSIPVDYETPSGMHSVSMALVPVRWTGVSRFPWPGRLLTWEEPHPDDEYAIGVDTSEGVGQDRSVIEVVRIARGGGEAAQVAELASPRLNSLDLWPFALAVAQFYSHRRPDGSWVRPQFVIETRWNGENVQLELQKRGWPNFYTWTRYDRRTIAEGMTRNVGWRTTSWSRPQMMDYMVKAIRDGNLLIRSPYLVEELKTLESDEGAQDSRARHGAHDDRVMALGIAFFTSHVRKVSGDRAGAARETVLRADDPGPCYRQPDYGVVWQP